MFWHFMLWFEFKLSHSADKPPHSLSISSCSIDSSCVHNLLKMSLGNLVVTLKSSPFTLQRLYLPETFFAKDSGRYAFVELSDSSNFICRIYHRELLQRDCCLLEKSVQYSSSHSSQLPAKLSKITVIQLIKPVRSMRVSVILTRIENSLVWKDKKSTYSSLLKQLLQLFVVNTGCVINLQNFEAAKKLGVRCVCVNDIGIQVPGRVTPVTKVTIVEILSWERYSLKHDLKPIEIAGMNAAHERLKKFITSRGSLRGNSLANNYDFSQLMVIGPNGSGKKTLIRKTAQDCAAVLVQLDCTRLMRPKPGDTEALIREKFEHSKLLAEEGLVILLILHIEIICSKPGRILNQINDLLDSIARLPNLIVATTSSDPNVIHESAKSASRFNNVIFLGVPSEAERLEMLKMMCRDDIVLDNEKMRELARMTPGCVLADLALIMNQARRQLSSADNFLLSKDRAFSCLKSAIASTEPSAVRGELGLVKANSSIHQIGGLGKIKESLIQFVQWPLVHSDAFRRMNIRHSSGILLYGPPGCAKTSLARAVAAENNVTFLSVSAADLYSSYVGDTERTISTLFQRARAAAPTLLFIDEIDALVGSRQGAQKRAQERVLSSFLIEMDGVGVNAETEFLENPTESKVVIIAATNRPHVIDSALLRPGRFDKLIYVPPPDCEDRLDILRVLTKEMPLDENVNLPVLAEKSELFSGADLANLCREAAFHSMSSRGVNTTTISHQDFLTALESSQPSLSASQVEWYMNFSF